MNQMLAVSLACLLLVCLTTLLIFLLAHKRWNSDLKKDVKRFREGKSNEVEQIREEFHKLLDSKRRG
jgi:hypothetical protein